MQFSTINRAGLGLLLVLSFSAMLVSAHSWVESVYKVDPATRKFFGPPGFPRGGSFRRLSTDGLTDIQYIHRLPFEGVWTGDENMNKDPIGTVGLPEETLEVAPGDFIAIQHLENGHVSEITTGRPLNGGTVFIYGTSEPKDNDKVFDMHLKWNEDGTGGDKRGRLLGTRNFDDKQCYEGNGRQVSVDRSAELGTEATMSLPCQSDIQLPDDLEPGSTYTIYWYWDWPTLNTEVMDMEATRDGAFPWSGAFARGDKDTLGYGPDVIAGAEGYASTIDVKVVEKDSYSAKAATIDSAPVDPAVPQPPEVYSLAIEKQLEDNNFAVKVPSYEGGDNGGDKPLPSSQVPEPPPMTKVPQADPETVTVTKTVTEPAEAEPTPCTPTSTQTVTEMETQITTVWADAPTTMVTSTRSLADSSSGYSPTPSAKLAARSVRSNWTASARGFVARPRNVRAGLN